MIRIFTISLLLALCACTDQQTELGDASRAPRFGVESIEDTKGSIINTSNITSMSVFCAHTGKEQYSSTATSNWMHNAAVTRTTENPEWTVQGEGVNKQWKDDGYHSFFAFAPDTLEGAEISASDKQGPPTLTYTVPAKYTDQVDLLYSHTTLINGKQMYIGSRPVVFGFRHALAKITFEVARAADVDPSTYFAIDKISLQNIHSTGTLAFEMDPELKQVISAGWSSVSGLGNYVVESAENKGLKFRWTTGYQMHPISEDNTSLFVLPQKIDENAVMKITFFETIHGVYSPDRVLEIKLSDILSEFQVGKAYCFSIVLNEDKVTVTAEIQPWADQTVDVAVPGTYLNVAPLSLSLPQGTAGDIYYSADGSPVTATCDNGITLTHDPIAKKFTFPSTAPVGNYTVTITAGKLTRNVSVEVTEKEPEPEPEEPPYIQIGDLLWATGNLVAHGENDCKVGQPQDGGLYFQWGSLIGWTGGANGDVQVSQHLRVLRL